MLWCRMKLSFNRTAQAGGSAMSKVKLGTIFVDQREFSDLGGDCSCDRVSMLTSKFCANWVAASGRFTCNRDVNMVGWTAIDVRFAGHAALHHLPDSDRRGCCQCTAEGTKKTVWTQIKFWRRHSHH